MKQYFILAAFFISSLAFASTDAHGGHGGIPWKTIMYQSINVSIMVVGLIYFLRNPIKTFFKEKKTIYLSAAEKAQSAKAAAEQEHLEIQVKLSKLENTSDESISRARAEAADLKKQLIEEAKTISQRMKAEAEASVKLEIEKAKNHLREEMIREAIKLSRTQISTKVSAEDHKRLQGDFIESIKAAQP